VAVAVAVTFCQSVFLSRAGLFCLWLLGRVVLAVPPLALEVLEILLSLARLFRLAVAVAGVVWTPLKLAAKMGQTVPGVVVEALPLTVLAVNLYFWRSEVLLAEVQTGARQRQVTGGAEAVLALGRMVVTPFRVVPQVLVEPEQ